jgi:LmbE family N-acetylglucosaminyl deacetylase
MEPVPEDWERGLAVVAHPDDLEYGLASGIARFTDQGKEVSYVLVTSGEAGIDGLNPDDCKPLREEEQRRSAAVVGVDQVEFLGHSDGAVEYGIGLRRDLAGDPSVPTAGRLRDELRADMGRARGGQPR